MSSTTRGVRVKDSLTILSGFLGPMSALKGFLGHTEIGLEAFDPVMANVNEVIDQLVRRRAELRAELTKVDEAINLLSSLAGAIDSVDANALNIKPAKQTPIERQRERGILPPEEIARFARNTLLKSGQPLKRGALVEAMERDGVPIAGKDKAKNLGTILWRHQEDFVSLENLGYWPRDVAIKGVYDPRKPPDGIRSPRLKKAN